MDLFLHLDAWLSSLPFAGLMIVGWRIGSRIGRARSSDGASSLSTRIEDASLALFGLLLAFCFSGATARYEGRKELLRDDALAIGELASVSSALEEPDRSDLQRELRTYTAQRLTFGTMRLDDEAMPRTVSAGRAARGARRRRASGRSSVTRFPPRTPRRSTRRW